jgi:hypothetical protein
MRGVEGGEHRTLADSPTTGPHIRSRSIRATTRRGSPGGHRARRRVGRYRNQHCVRPEQARELQGVDRRQRRCCVAMAQLGAPTDNPTQRDFPRDSWRTYSADANDPALTASDRSGIRTSPMPRLADASHASDSLDRASCWCHSGALQRATGSGQLARRTQGRTAARRSAFTRCIGHRRSAVLEWCVVFDEGERVRRRSSVRHHG